METSPLRLSVSNYLKTKTKTESVLLLKDGAAQHLSSLAMSRESGAGRNADSESERRKKREGNIHLGIVHGGAAGPKSEGSGVASKHVGVSDDDEVG